MKPLLTLFVLALGLGSSGFAADSSPGEVVQIDHQKLAAALAKGGPLLAAGNYKIQAGHREGPGQVEIHTADTDIFYVLEGGATLITGGSAVDAKEVSPGELRSEKSTGGVTRHITKGDVVVIPAGVPHWMPEVTKPFDYLVVKVTGGAAHP